MKVCVRRSVATDASLALVFDALTQSRLDVVFAEASEFASTDADCLLVFDEPLTLGEDQQVEFPIPIVSISDRSDTPLHRSDALDVAQDGCIEAVVHVAPRDGRASRKVSGWINDQGGAVWTLASVLTVLPTMVRRALADDALPRGATRIEPLPAVRPAARSSRVSRVLAGIKARTWARFHHRLWWVGLVEGTSVDGILANPSGPLDVRWLDGAPKRCWWADPCSVSDGDNRWVFVEEFDRRLRRGRIVALLVGDGRTLDRHVVLSGPHHRALPRVWRSNAAWLATADTCESPAPIFTFDRLGDPWIPIEGMFLPADISDPAITEDDGEWTLTGSLTTEIADAVTRTWTAGIPSELGPSTTLTWSPCGQRARVDIASARGAGSIDVLRGIRAVQDCTSTYGAAVSLIRHPAVGARRVEPIVRLDGSSVVGLSKQIDGMHTLAWTPDGQFVVTDAWRETFSIFEFWCNRRVCKSCAGCAA